MSALLEMPPPEVLLEPPPPIPPDDTEVSEGYSPKDNLCPSCGQPTLKMFTYVITSTTMARVTECTYVRENGKPCNYFKYPEYFEVKE